MKDMRHVISSLADASGQSGLEPNAEGVFELIFNDVLPVYFRILNDEEMEVQIRVPDMTSELDSDAMSAILQANTQTRAGRFALEPGSNNLIFGTRLNISAHDRDGLIRLIDAAIREGAAWNSTRYEDLRGKTGAIDVSNETFLRV